MKQYYMKTKNINKFNLRREINNRIIYYSKKKIPFEPKKNI
jgi:hypothetical protein